MIATTTVAEQLIVDAETYDRNAAWTDSDEFIARMFRAWPRNDDLWTVQQKVVALDGLYGTQLGQWQGWHEVARHIVSLGPSLDEYFGVGALDAVEMIRRIPLNGGIMRNTYVFATKYAHWHNPEAYPIYDSRVARALPLLAQKTPGCDALGLGHDYTTLFQEYAAFKAVHDACRRAWVPDWSYKRFDKALYVRGARTKQSSRSTR